MKYENGKGKAMINQSVSGYDTRHLLKFLAGLQIIYAQKKRVLKSTRFYFQKSLKLILELDLLMEQCHARNGALQLKHKQRHHLRWNSAGWWP